MDPRFQLGKESLPYMERGHAASTDSMALIASNQREVSVRFAELAELAESLAGEGSKLKKRAAIADAVRRAAGESAPEAGRFCLYLAGQPFAEADRRKLNAGGAILSRVLKQITEASDAALNIAYRKHGDLGAAAFDLLHAREQGSG